MTQEESSMGMFEKTEDGDIEAGRTNGPVSAIEKKDTSIEISVQRMADQGNNDEHADEIDKWASSLERLLEEVPQYICGLSHPGRISRIPDSLREVDIKAYEPCFLSIGPYHHGKPKFIRMERRKHFVLKCFLERKPEISLKDYLNSIKSIEPAARSFYSDIQIESEKFLQMLLLDSLFILPLFCGMPQSRERTYRENEGLRTGQMMARDDELNEEMIGENCVDPPRWCWTYFAHDFFLLENQLPFFVLQNIHKLAYGGSESQLISIMKYHVGNMLLDYAKLDSDITFSPTEEVHHILHLCHMFFRPILGHDSIASQLPESNQIFRLASAVQLYKTGVSFEPRSDSSVHSLLDVTFSTTGKMVMPCLHVDDNTNSLLRNLIALEQMKYPSLGLHVSGYAVLLLHLVTIPEDVKLLRRKGIIQHHLASDKEMMYLVNRLSVGLSFDYVEDNYSLKPLFLELKRYTELRVPRWRASLKHRYFSNPWTVISLLAASFLLLLSAVQTYYTVYAYYHPL